MKKIDPIYIVLSVIVAVSSYIVTNNLFLPLGVFLVYVLYYFVIARRKLGFYFARANNIHCCYHFINSFLITLSVKESFEEAYQNGIRITDEALVEETSQIENMPIIDRIKYLRRFFNLSIYRMFVNVVIMYQEQGGNILNLSDGLIKECTRVEKSLTDSMAIGTKHLVEFIILWFLSLLILVFLRFSMSQFYFQMIDSPLMIGFIVGFYLIILGSTHLFLSKFCQLSIKEDNEDEKD